MIAMDYVETQGLTGILMFHFDFWFNPMEFHHMDFNTAWFLEDEYGFSVLNNYRGHWDNETEIERMLFRGWGFTREMKAIWDTLHSYYPAFDANEFISQWSDFGNLFILSPGYFPQRHFRILRNALRLLMKFDTCLEIGFPLMTTLCNTVAPVDFIHCYGGCCDWSSPENITDYRFGHRIAMDLLPSKHAHFDRLCQDGLYCNVTALPE